MKTKIILADDHKILREGIKNLLNNEWSLEVIAEAKNGREAVGLVEENKPDIIIMDIGMPELNGIEATIKIKEQSPETKVIALSMHSDKQFITKMLKAGASGYLLKDCAVDDLVKAINSVMENNIFLSPKISGVLVNEFINASSNNNQTSSTELSIREKEVLQLIAEGKSTREVAELLFISIKTVESHRKNIMVKLDLHTIPELTKYAIRSGLTFLEE